MVVLGVQMVWAERTRSVVNDIGCLADMQCESDHESATICHLLTEENHIELGLLVEGVADSSFVGLGVTEGGMYGADIVTYSMELGLQDRHATGFVTPRIDAEQNGNLICGGAENGRMYFRFRRSLVPCDREEDHPIPRHGMTNFIWASGYVLNGDVTYHGSSRGTMFVNVLDDDVLPATNTSLVNLPVLAHDGSQSVDLAALFATRKDVHHRSCTNLPSHGHKHAWEFSIRNDNPDYVHHMVIYLCASAGCGGGCGGSAGGHGSNMFFSWNKGGQDRIVFPEGVAFSFADYKSVKLEVHYNSRGNKPAAALDQSGYNLKLGPARDYEAELAWFGRISTFSLPPGKPSGSSETTIDCFAPSQCFSHGETKHFLFGSIHAHTRARSATLRHFRNHVELEPVIRKYYDYNYQPFVPIEMEIRPGDSLQLTCQFDTTGETSTVHGGQATDNEMCMLFIMSYPKGGYTQIYHQPGHDRKSSCGGVIDYSEFDAPPRSLDPCT